jgi:hypothetical protein
MIGFGGSAHGDGNDENNGSTNWLAAEAMGKDPWLMIPDLMILDHRGKHCRQGSRAESAWRDWGTWDSFFFNAWLKVDKAPSLRN